MQAVRFHRYGPASVLEVAHIDEPVPRAGEVKVKVFAASLNPLDWKIRAGHVRLIPLFARPPRTVGVDLAGEIVGVGGGPAVRYVGERVFGSLPPFGRDGSCAEYAVIAARRVVPIPETFTYEQAATTPVAAGTAAQVLIDEADLATGQRALINGAAGGVGHFAVQLAKHRGAYVVATCSADNAAFVRELGADEVVDYAKHDVTVRDDRFDLVFDVAESLGWYRAHRLLARGGRYVGMGGSVKSAVTTTIAGIASRLLDGSRSHTVVLRDGGASCRRLADLLARSVLRPHITQRVALAQVGEAQQRMETGHGRGKIVVLPQSGSE